MNSIDKWSPLDVIDGAIVKPPPRLEPVLTGPEPEPVAVATTVGPLDDTMEEDYGVGGIFSPRAEPSPKQTIKTAAQTRFTAQPRREPAPVWSQPTPLWAVLATVVVTLLGAATLVVNLGSPETLVFDESYYVKQADSMIRYGTEMKVDSQFTADGATPNANDLFVDGQAERIWSEDPDFVAHPPLGKWLLASGQAAFGQDNPWGWRAPVALVGALSVLLLIRLARRLFRSEMLGILAGVLMVFDGAHFVAFRTGILDPFLAFFVLLAIWLFAVDRDVMRVRAKLAAEGSRGVASGITMRITVWRVLMLLSLSLAVSVKWSGLPIMAVLCILMVVLDTHRFRTHGNGWMWASAKFAVLNFVIASVTLLATYTATWSGWFASDNGYGRGWGQDNPVEGAMTFVPDTIRSWVNLHQQMWQFNTTLTSPHPSQSSPWGWMWLEHPTLFYKIQSGDTIRIITYLGTPSLWWVACAVMVPLLFFAVFKRDKIAMLISTGLLGGWVFWFAVAHRTIYNFYAVTFEPFVVLTVVWGVWKLSSMLGRVHWWLTGFFVAVTIGMFVFWYPLWTGMEISQEFYDWHMWMPGWN